MKWCINSSRRIITATVTIAITLTASVGFAQSVDSVLEADKQRIRLAQKSQQNIDATVETTRSLEDQYRAITKEVDGLKVYNRLMSAQTDGQAASLADIARSMDQVNVIDRQIFPLMERMIDGLEDFVALDLPFNMKERSERIENLKTLMGRSDVSVAEKFRKVMEAYQIENDFGRTIESYEEDLTLPDGSQRLMQVLRIGRIGLFYQSEDARITLGWDNEQRAVVELPDSFRNEVKKGLKVATQQIAPDLLLLPIPPAVEAS